MKVSRETLHQLIANKLNTAGLTRNHADIIADVLVYADARGIHSHGAVRVEYYAERISKGGTNRHPTFTFEKNGPCSGILHAARDRIGQGKRRGRGRHPAYGPQRSDLLLHPAGRPRRANRDFAVPVRPDGRAFWRGGNLLRNQPAGLCRARRGR